MNPDSGGQAILAVSDLSFAYNGKAPAVLRDLGLAIPARAVTAILGPNGSGKTTLLRLLLGVLRPQRGTVHLLGRPLDDYSRRQRGRLLGLVPQDEHIPFEFSVLEYVLLGRAPYLGPLEMPGLADRMAAEEALRVAGLAELRDRPLPNLSGGERQLAVVARALAQQPSVLLMDEPTAHLDLGNRGRLLTIMRSLSAGGATVVLTTHDPNLASEVAQHVVLMRRGEIVKVGRTEGVLTSENLSAIYGVPVQVLEIGQRRAVLLS
jgi:iron complex transport system ATP-binding protein